MDYLLMGGAVCVIIALIVWYIKYNSKNQLIKVYNKSYGDKYTYNAQGLVKSYFFTYGGTEELTYDSKKNKKTSVIYYRYDIGVKRLS